jgi:APA family basic amino acid/polyamine antiporter
VGSFVAPIIALLGTLLLLISSNAGVYGSSRIMYSMATNGLAPSFFTRVNARFLTPVVSLVVFCSIAIGELIFSGLTPDAANTLGDMYAFGAASSYTLVFVSLLVLRYTDRETPRTFRVPWNVRVHWHGEPFELPIVGVLGLLGISSVLAMVFITHPIGRVAGPAWLILGLIGYTIYRRRQHRPVLRTIHHDWPEKQLEVYEESGELALADEYRAALKRRARRAHAVTPATVQMVKDQEQLVK